MNITFDEFDKLERKPLAEKLTEVISTFYPFNKEAYVLSLNACFGSGKTTFLKMWQSYLESKEYEVFYLNAWENDFDDEPIIPIAGTLLQKLDSRKEVEKNVQAALRGVLGVAALISNSALNQVTGVDVHDILKAVEQDLTEGTDAHLQKQGEKIYEGFFYKRKAYDKLKEALKAYVASLEKKPLIILVDELDRVRPDYSVKFLEAIKHIFSVQGVCFVLAVDREQLERSVQQMYGALDFDNYYRRFVTREVKLPQATSVKNLRGFIDQVAYEYFDEKINGGISFAFAPEQKPKILAYATSVCRSFELTPRQIEYLFRIYSQFMAIKPNNDSYMDSWLQAPLILIAMLIKNKNKIYDKVGTGTLSPTDLYNYLSELNYSGDRKADDRRTIILHALAFSLHDENEDFKKDAALITKTHFMQNMPQDSDPLGQLAAMVDRFRGIHSESVFQKFYKKFEEWRGYID